ncbi:glycosyltransferase family 4 protein [Marinospirillum sp. MEB164]|uniref:Glycosyltransferase family 4 protein n=1 Tax=Marinospirillum alkalitolerans TaxID=3123374 RepID=A0ABW8PV11_9GAMM
MPGGADVLVTSLMHALKQTQHEVELLRLPFLFAPEQAIHAQMDYCEQLDLQAPNGQPIDLLLSLQFPGYGIHHPHHRIWLMHQHRAAYELAPTIAETPAQKALKERIHQYDQQHLQQAEKRFTISQRVAQRIQDTTQLPAQAVYHPPAGEANFYCAEAWDYVFYPSRLETLKRQELLIEAARYLRTPLKILIAGDGGQAQHYQQRIIELGVEDRVQLMGRITEKQKLACYAHALAVAFIPWDEDLGYITLEAMLAAKPLVTCHDSGGPLEFVQDQHTGLVCTPDPRALAEAFDQLYLDKKKAYAMGQAGRQAYQDLNLSWQHTLSQLLGDAP